MLESPLRVETSHLLVGILTATSSEEAEMDTAAQTHLGVPHCFTIVKYIGWFGFRDLVFLTRNFILLHLLYWGHVCWFTPLTGIGLAFTASSGSSVGGIEGSSLLRLMLISHLRVNLIFALGNIAMPVISSQLSIFSKSAARRKIFWTLLPPGNVTTKLIATSLSILFLRFRLHIPHLLDVSAYALSSTMMFCLKKVNEHLNSLSLPPSPTRICVEEKEESKW